MRLYDLIRGKGLRRSRTVRTIYKHALRAFLSGGGFIAEGIEGGGSIKFWPRRKSSPLKIIGDYVEEMVWLVMDALEPGAVFVDVGAYEGLYTMFASPKCSRVYAFEPSPAMYHILKSNLKLNRIRNATAENLLVMDKPGRAKLYLDDVNPTCTSTIIRRLPAIPTVSEQAGGKGGRAAGGCAEVEATTLDKYLLADNKVERVDFVKIDTEGADGLVILGMKNVLEKFRPKMQIELFLDAMRSAGTDPLELLKLLRSYKYQPLHVRNYPFALAERDWDSLLTNITKPDFPSYSNLLLL